MVYSADGIPRAEALASQKGLAALLSYKLKWEYSEMCGFIRERMSLEIKRGLPACSSMSLGTKRHASGSTLS